MTEIPPKNIFLVEQILEKSKVGLGHPSPFYSIKYDFPTPKMSLEMTQRGLLGV